MTRVCIVEKGGMVERDETLMHQESLQESEGEVLTFLSELRWYLHDLSPLPASL